MKPTTQRILDEVARLSPIERAEIIEHILESFDAEPDREITASWVKEAELRLNRYKEGTTSAVSEEEAYRSIEKGAGK